MGKDDVSAENKDRVMRDVPAEELRKNEAHDKKSQKRREKTPKHPEVRALVFLFKVPLHKLTEEEKMLFYAQGHRKQSLLSSSF